MTHRIALSAIALLTLAACAGPGREPPRLADARTQVDAAAADPAVARAAAPQIQEARQDIAKAERDWREDDQGALDHDIYLAQRHVAIARARTDAETARQQAQAAATEAQVQALERQLHARQTPQGTALTLADVLFEPGKATLRPGALNRMRPLADFLRSHPDAHATIEGFTDSTGGAEFNQQLSQQRAEAVKNYLVGEGIEPERIAARGMGQDFPVASNATAAGRQQNRRVEVLLSEAPM